MQEQPIYGAQYYSNEQTGVSDARSLGEALRVLYDPSDFVIVKNVDSQPVTYQFTQPDGVETFSDYPGHKDTVVKVPPRRYTLQPGEQKLCPAYEADMMITTLVKQILMRRANEKVASGEAKPDMAVDWSNVATQDSLLNTIFLGKYDVTQQYNIPQETNKADVTASVEAELGLSDDAAAKPRTRRPAGNPTA